MALSAGTRLGAYEITSKLGEGDMGEVHRAHDTKLHRDVAIKVLPEAFTRDPDRLGRFEREAQTLAALNHPNIAQIHGVTEHPVALVMEFVDGEDLAQRVARGPVPLDEALAIARQIADALEAAHTLGIVHRDLKPANVRVRPDGTVKVLDFGLAKAMTDAPPGEADVANSPTFTSPAMRTEMGVILGTAAYMSPEQARGKAVGERTDIWAFGVVLFEMLTGERPFDGSDASEVMARVIERDPDFAALPSATPHAVHRLLHRCLVKDPQRRLAAIADARLEIEEAAAPSDLVTPAPRAPRVLLAAMGVLAVAVAVATWGWIRAARDTSVLTAGSTYVAATLRVDGVNLTTLTDRFAVSRDGTMLALVDRSRGGLLLRRMDELEATPITGAPSDAHSPVFSPDGEWIAFASASALMKIPTAGGTPTVLVAGSDYFINLTWSADDRIRYPSLHNDAIRTISASGGPVETTTFGPSTYVTRAVGLPSQRLLVSLMMDGERRIAVRDPDGTLRRLLDGWDARLTPTGHLLFSRQEGTTWSIVAAAFDANTAQLRGEAMVLGQAAPVRYATPAGADEAGNLFYIGGSPRSDRRVVLLDRTGAERDLRAPPGVWVDQEPSPDGRQLVLTRFEGARRTLWTLTLDTGALTQVTYVGDTFSPRWTPDGRRLVFSSFPIDTNPRATSLWSVLTDGRGMVEPVSAQWDAYANSVSSDGRLLYYNAYRSEQSEADIMSVSLDDGEATPTIVLATPASEDMSQVSPDGRWLAYQTNASGAEEVRVASLADLAVSVQISAQGGFPIRWSADGRALYYQDGDTIASVEVGPDGPVLSSRSVLFAVPGDSRGFVKVMPGGTQAVTIRGGLIYSDIVVLQHALSPAR